MLVLAAYGRGPCTAPEYRNCIVARRQFSFVDNVRLHLPITLEASCKDVPCDALSSCRSGECVSSAADCTTDGTCEASAEPVVAPDGATVPPPADATIDVPSKEGSVSPPEEDVSKPIDTGADAPPDGAVANPGGGNNCPSSEPGPDCRENAPGDVCCRQMDNNFACAPSGMACLDEHFPCTGRKHCLGGEWCCAAPTPVPGQTSACMPDPSCGGGVMLCNFDSDCPSPRTCTGSAYMIGLNGHMKTCNGAAVASPPPIDP